MPGQAAPEPRMREERVSDRRSRFLFGPLERGYADGLGTVLRRALLGAVPGYAVDSVAVSGVADAYESIPGADCDLADLALSLSRVALAAPSGLASPVMSPCASTRLAGPMEVTAGDLAYPEGLEPADPGLRLFSLADGFSADVALTASCGRGPSMACDRAACLPAGAVGVDALYSPVVSVACSTRPARSGGRVDLDELVLDVSCDGTVAPADALSSALCAVEEHMARMMAALGTAPGGHSSVFESLTPDEVLLVDERPVEFLALPPATYRLALRNGALTVGRVRCELRAPLRRRSPWVTDAVAAELAKGISRLDSAK